VTRELDQREPVPDERGGIAAAQLEGALERLDRLLRRAVHQLRLAQDDQRLPVLRLRCQQRLEHLDRGRDIARGQQLLGLVELIPVLVEHELAGEIS